MWPALRRARRTAASWCFSRFLEGQDDGDHPDLGRLLVENLRLKMSSSSCLGLGPRALGNVGGYHLAPGRLWRACEGWPCRSSQFSRQRSSFHLSLVRKERFAVGVRWRGAVMGRMCVRVPTLGKEMGKFTQRVFQVMVSQSIRKI